MDTPSGTLEVPQNSLSSGSGSNVGSDYKQVACFFGDLAHKKSVVGHFQQLGPAVVSYFSSLHRAWYVRAHRPDLVPDGITNVKRLAEIFEFQYQTSVPFTFGYDSWLPETLSRAPTDEEASASGYLLNWLSRSSVAKLPHAELADAMAQFDFQHPRAREVFEFPLDQRDPGIWIPATQDAQVQLDWALEARFHFGYPDICGYVRGGNGYTPGDSSPWFMSSRSRLNGLGCIGIRFPPKRSIFDNDPPGSHNDRWPVDGLWHPNNEHSFLGFKVHIWVLGWQTKFTDPLFNGPYFTTVVPKSRADLGLFVDFAGEPGQVAYFIVRRDVIWSSGRWDPPPDYPGNEPNPHIEL